MGRTNATACYRELGAELRRYREQAALTGDDIARVTGWHRTKVSRVEMGQVGIGVVDAVHYLGACKVFATEAKQLLRLCEEARRNRGYWLDRTFNSLIFHEAAADRSTSYEPMVVPGLLQTPGYARACIDRTPGFSRDDAIAALRLREQRQQIMHRARPGDFTFYLHEQALRPGLGTPALMYEQLLKLISLAELPHVTLRVLPAAAGNRALVGGAFRLFEYRGHRPLAYLDHPWAGLFLEDQEFVVNYRATVPKLSAVALDEAESKAFIAEMANTLDRGNQPREAGIYELAEEHL